MSDLISRKAAIEAMEQRYCDIERVKKRPVTEGEQAIFLDMRGVVRSLPSWRCRMSDLISRRDAIDALAKFVPYAICDESTESYTNGLKDSYNLICQLPSAEPKTKCIAQIKVDRDDIEDMVNEMAKEIAEPKMGRDCTDFVRWLMDEVLDEENWQWNAVANGEIICRKLKKLGLIDVVDGYYVETQETGWIPVSEMLPKKDGRYLVARYDDVTNTEFIDILWYEENLWWNRHSTGDYAVTAWMPLPEPYRGGDAE